MRKLRFKREVVEHRPDGTGRRRYPGKVYEIGDDADQVTDAAARPWLSDGTAEEVIPPRASTPKTKSDDEE